MNSWDNIHTKVWKDAWLPTSQVCVTPSEITIRKTYDSEVLNHIKTYLGYWQSDGLPSLSAQLYSAFLGRMKWKPPRTHSTT